MNRQILDEASAWFVDFRVGDVDVRARKEFNKWLRSSPEHIRAYLQIAETYADLPALKEKGAFDLEQLVARARTEHNIRPLGHERVRAELEKQREAESAPPAVTPRMGSRRRLLAFAAMLLVAIGAGFAGWYVTIRESTYTTAIGEQRSIVLEDGSLVELNSRSRVRVRFTEQARTVELLEGQALFRVAKNPVRPFIVESGDASVRAVGTAFDVYRKTTGTVVTVVEGRVAVSAAGIARPKPGRPTPRTMVGRDSEAGDTATAREAAPAKRNTSGVTARVIGGGEAPEGGSAAGKVEAESRSGAITSQPRLQPSASSAGVNAQSAFYGLEIAENEVLLTAGEQVTIDPAAEIAPTPTQANLAAATAWMQRQLIFNSSPLTEVAEEFNRYNTRRLVIEDPELSSFNISGVYGSTNPTSLVRFLRTQPGIVVRETDSQIIISQQ